MKEYMQSYHAFLPAEYMKWVLYLVYPAALLLIPFVGRIWLEGFGESVILIGLGPIIFMAVECIIDMFVFAGFGSRENIGHMEFVKTSVRGKRMIRQALIVDGVRRFLYLILAAAAGYAAFCINGWGSLGGSTMWWMFLCTISGAGFFCSIVLWIIRLTDNRIVQFMSLYFSFTIAMGVLTVFSVIFTIDLNWMFVICSLLYIVSVVGQIWYLVRKMKEGYYDE